MFDILNLDFELPSNNYNRYEISFIGKASKISMDKVL